MDNKTTIEQMTHTFARELEEFKLKVLGAFGEDRGIPPTNINWRLFFMRNRTGYINFYEGEEALGLLPKGSYLYGITQIDSPLQDYTTYFITIQDKRYDLNTLLEKSKFTAEGACFYV